MLYTWIAIFCTSLSIVEHVKNVNNFVFATAPNQICAHLYLFLRRMNVKCGFCVCLFFSTSRFVIVQFEYVWRRKMVNFPLVLRNNNKSIFRISFFASQSFALYFFFASSSVCMVRLYYFVMLIPTYIAFNFNLLFEIIVFIVYACNAYVCVRVCLSKTPFVWFVYIIVTTFIYYLFYFAIFIPSCNGRFNENPQNTLAFFCSFLLKSQ